ncbi:MAG: hypothetical protein SNJ33_03805 [Rikenellaceae bacterium]
MKSGDNITSLEVKVKTLIADHKRLKSLLHEAAVQIRSLEEENRSLQAQRNESQKEISRLQLTDALAGSGDAAASRDKARGRVNRLLREVDQCINLLKQ